tara:strand:+ start:290 stop:397 length:108 start_codon:yes stop_codon:yes gene_type:complete
MTTQVAVAVVLVVPVKLRQMANKPVTVELVDKMIF